MCSNVKVINIKAEKLDEQEWSVKPVEAEFSSPELSIDDKENHAPKSAQTPM